MKKLNTALLMTIFANTGFSMEPFPDETHKAAYQAHLAARYISRERYQAHYLSTHSSLPATARRRKFCHTDHSGRGCSIGTAISEN